MSIYEKEDYYLFFPNSFTPNYEAALTQLVEICETIINSSDVMEDFFIQMLEALQWNDNSPVTRFRDIHLYLLNSYV
jgi:hypothetical protein